MNTPFLLDRCRDMHVGNQIQADQNRALIFDETIQLRLPPRGKLAVQKYRLVYRPAPLQRDIPQHCSAFQLALGAVERAGCYSEVEAPLLHRQADAQSTTMAFGNTPFLRKTKLVVREVTSKLKTTPLKSGPLTLRFLSLRPPLAVW